jgi:hypothetical protein
MTCACEGGGGENDPEALLDGVTSEQALVIRVKIYDETHIVTLRQVRQDNRSERYESVWQHENGQRDQKTRGRAATVALIAEIVLSDSYLGAEYGSIEEMWPDSSDDQIDEIDGNAR